jgi:ABC-type lipoprotein release transport system permease subunit
VIKIRRTLTMMTTDKALLIGWAGVILGVARGFWVAHTSLPLDDAINADFVYLGFGGVALFILLNRRISDGYRVVYALAIFIFTILSTFIFLAPATTLFLASALRRYFRKA